jgi:4-amino-4-deoxychorismate lyase
LTVTSTKISIQDRAFNYGDGCFTTISVFNSVAQLIDLHIKRLQSDCLRLQIPYGDWLGLRREIINLAKQSQGDKSVLKVLVSRGEGGRGYSPEGSSSPRIYISKHPFPQHYADWNNAGIKLGVAKLNLAKQPMLAGVKHLNRLEQVLVKNELADTDLDDLLVLDSDQYVVETSASNVFWYSETLGWCTPKLDKAGVAGVMRQSIIEFMLTTGIEVNIDYFEVEELVEAKQAFICNSLMNIVPVRLLKIGISEYQKPTDSVALFNKEYLAWLGSK